MTLEVSPLRRPKDSIDNEIARLAPWFHNLHLPSGHQTAPNHRLRDFPRVKWDQIAAFIPRDLSGATALDIGCNAGFYSFELAVRGAAVTAIDHDEHYLAQARWAAERMPHGDNVEFKRMDVYDLADMTQRFDIVLFMGVLYHLRYPLLALDLAASKTTKLLVFQTLSMPGDDVTDAPRDLGIDDRDVMTEAGWPKMAFIEHGLEGDPTNWWAPNHAAIEAMARSCGLRVVAHPGHEIYVCEPQGLPPAVERELDAALHRGRERKG